MANEKDNPDTVDDSLTQRIDEAVELIGDDESNADAVRAGQVRLMDDGWGPRLSS